jgi:hypothetical protein
MHQLLNSRRALERTALESAPMAYKAPIVIKIAPGDVDRVILRSGDIIIENPTGRPIYARAHSDCVHVSFCPPANYGRPKK